MYKFKSLFIKIYFLFFFFYSSSANYSFNELALRQLCTTELNKIIFNNQIRPALVRIRPHRCWTSGYEEKLGIFPNLISYTNKKMEIFNDFFSRKKFLWLLYREKFTWKNVPNFFLHLANFHVKLMALRDTLILGNSLQKRDQTPSSFCSYRFITVHIFEEKTYVFLPKYLNIIHYVNCNYI